MSNKIITQSLNIFARHDNELDNENLLRFNAKWAALTIPKWESTAQRFITWDKRLAAAISKTYTLEYFNVNSCAAK